MPQVSLAVSLFVLLGALIPGFAAAQPSPRADLGIQALILDRVTAGDPNIVYGYLRNHGPDAAENVVLTTSAGRFVDSSSCVADNAGRCTLENFRAGGEVGFQVRLDREPVAGTVDVELNVTSATPDANPANNQVRGQVTFVLATELFFHISGLTADPGGAIEYESSVFNYSPIAATNVRFTFPLPAGWTFERSLSDALQCSTADGSVQCTIARIEPRETVRGRFLMRAPVTPNGSTYQSVPVTLTTDHGVLTRDHRVLDSITTQFSTVVYRHFRVTTAANEGEGSLRHALTRANAECGLNDPPCKIVFDVAGAGSHVTIQPLTPLPAIRVGLVIDGATQTAWHGDTNPAGPEVEINGSHLTAGNGLEVALGNMTFELRNVVLNGFPGSGVVIRSSGYYRVVAGNYIGTDVTGRHAVPNGRGVTHEIDLDDVNNTVMANLRLIENVISGNRRSGVFAVNGYDIGLYNNRIGASAGERPEPLGNGASGIYLGSAVSAVVIQKNIIAFNAESGIATAKPTGWVAIHANSIFDNGLLGIDFGLDLVTPNPEPGKFGDIPPFPVLTSAHYDAATNTTRIEGRVGGSSWTNLSDVELFANDSPGTDGHAQGELYLGRTRSRDFKFTFDYRGDLRGRYLTATYTVPNNYYPEALPLRTSEFSASLRVDGEAAGPIDPAAVVPRGADLAIRSAAASFQLRAGMTGRIHTIIDNLGPEVAKDVVVEVTTDGGRLSSANARCTELPNGLRCAVTGSSLDVDIETPVGPDKVTVRQRVTASNFDPDPTNNEAVVEIPIIVQPVLSVRVDNPGPADPGGNASYTFYIAHETTVEAREVEIRVRKPHDWTLVSGPSGDWTCAAEDSEIVCRTAAIAGGTTESFSYTLRAPDNELGVAGTLEPVRLSTAGNDDYHPTIWVVYEVYRVLTVTTNADEGAGSLRDAITRANIECASESRFNCKIAFDLDGGDPQNVGQPLRLSRETGQPERLSYVIRLRTPLPALGDALITIDGRTQPGVELNGSDLASGNGLELESTSDTVVRGLTITGFPESGIAVRTLSYTNYGVRRRIIDNRIVGNRGRGISVDTANSYSSWLDITGNVISGNARAGVFVASASELRITGNEIDGNGASGVYLGAAAEGVDVEGNQIAHNLHAGIGTDRAAAWNTIRGNAIFDNGGLGIDHALDMVTFNDADDRPADLPRFPVITSAVWDESAKVTRIQGLAERSGQYLAGVLVELFANDNADGEAQRSLGEVSLPPSEQEQPFSFEVAEDLRGKFVTATLSRRGPNSVHENWTSEISPAVPVQ